MYALLKKITQEVNLNWKMISERDNTGYLGYFNPF